MAAILHPTPDTSTTTWGEPTPWEAPERSARPHLVVLEGGHTHGHRPLRSRVAVVALALSASVGVWSLATAPAAHVRSTLADSAYVVRRGDTLWSIAGALGFEGDRRDVVDRLADVNGGYDIAVDQELVIPGDLQITGR